MFFRVCNHPQTFFYGFSALLPDCVFAGSAYEQAVRASEGVAGFERRNGAIPRWLAWGNLAGAVPVMGGIPVGLARIFFSIMRFNYDSYEGSALIVRGIAEIAGVGPLLFVMDVLYTVGRLLPRPPVNNAA